MPTNGRGGITIERRADSFCERGDIDVLGEERAVAISEMMHRF
jgi:hypothetical protein